MSQDNKEIVARWFKEFWGNPWNPAIIDELATSDILVHYPMHEPKKGRAAVTQLGGLELAGGGAGRHRRAAHRARFEQHIAFDSGVASRVENFATDDIYDSTHGFLKV